MKYVAEVREIDAWADPDGGWTWNNSFRIIDSVTLSERQVDNLAEWCEKEGLLRPGAAKLVRVEHDGGGLYEVQAADTGEPLYAFIGEWEVVD